MGRADLVYEKSLYLGMDEGFLLLQLCGEFREESAKTK
jgi:hypothetical protein